MNKIKMLLERRKRRGPSEFSQVFNFKTPESTGSTLLLTHTVLVNIFNIFITGAFYTTFLTVNGIDIVQVGIISFIPYIAWAFGLLTPTIYKKIKRRKPFLLFSHSFYYLCVVLATTVMPNFVTDPTKRTVWFAALLLLGNIVNAMFASGATAWHIRFIPNDQRRNIYFSWQNTAASVISCVTAIASALVADSLAGSPQQATVVITLRYVAFGMGILDGLILYLFPKEYPYKVEQGVKLKDVVTVPFKAKKFMYMAIVVFMWNMLCNVNGSTWSYYILNTVGVPYVFTYISTLVYAVGNILLLRWWRHILARRNWFTMLFVVILGVGILELPMSFVTEKTVWVFVVGAVLQGLNSVGLNLVFANLFYVNLPPDSNTDLFITFWNFIANIGVLLGSMFGTWFLSLFQAAEPFTIIGLPYYGSQFLVWFKFVTIILLAFWVRHITPKAMPDYGNTPRALAEKQRREKKS